MQVANLIPIQQKPIYQYPYNFTTLPAHLFEKSGPFLYHVTAHRYVFLLVQVVVAPVIRRDCSYRFDIAKESTEARPVNSARGRVPILDVMDRMDWNQLLRLRDVRGEERG